MTKLIQKNTTIPTKHSQIFSTAEDNQPAVTIKVYQGERELVQHNKILGEFNLEGIAPARRGQPQIEVTLDIDANGILSVSARDKNTGKENRITIKSDSGLSKDEIEAMIRDAEANADADKQQRKIIESRNQLDAVIHETQRDLDEHGKDLAEEDRTRIESAVTGARAAAQADDAEAMSKALADLMQAATPLVAKKNSVPAEGSGKQDESVVDAEFRESA
jgi:molecular chaperone DnaK